MYCYAWAFIPLYKYSDFCIALINSVEICNKDNSTKTHFKSSKTSKGSSYLDLQ